MHGNQKAIAALQRMMQVPHSIQAMHDPDRIRNDMAAFQMEMRFQFTRNSSLHSLQSLRKDGGLIRKPFIIKKKETAMNLLQESRIRINEIDDQLVRLFEERMHAVENVAKYKAENNMPVSDSYREKENIEKNSAKLEDQKLRKYFEEWYQYTMEVSKEYQKDMLKRD